MEVISKHKYSAVYFDLKENVFIKEFYPKLKYRIKYFLGLRKAPGRNFKYISDELNKIGLKTPEIIEDSDYYVKTKKVEGVLLEDYIKEDPSIIKKFLDVIVEILDRGIYFGDFNTKNFIVSNGEIYILDLEDYRKTILLPRRQDKTLMRLSATLKNKQWFEYVLDRLN